jgi:MFS family permease
MVIWAPLSHRPIRRMWFGQVLAAIGAELYAVAVIWTAIGLVGRDAGYIATLQAAAVLVGSLSAGALTDRWRYTTTMITADLARVALVLVLPVAHAFGWMSPALLLTVAVCVGLMTGWFDPALQATLTPLAPEPRLRHASNALFDATRRFARIAGPMLVFVLHRAMSTIGFFAVTAVSFAASAAAVAAVVATGVPLAGPDRTPHARSGLDAVIGGFRALGEQPLALYALCSAAIANITWAGGYLFGMALVFRVERSESLTGFAAMTLAYGVGNLLGNFVLASLPPTNAAQRIALSKLILGAGIVGLSLGPSLPLLMLIAALTAVNGPLGDLAVLQVLQSSFPTHVLGRVFRAQTCMAWGGMLAGYLLAPSLLSWVRPSTMVGALGGLSMAVGLVGLALRHWRWIPAGTSPMVAGE